MSESILCLIPTNPDGGLSRISLECLAAASQLKQKSGASLTIGCWGKAPDQGIAACHADRYCVVDGEAFASPRYATDVAAAEALVTASGASLVLAPASSRIQRFLPGLAARLKGVTDTHVTGIDFTDGKYVATRWFYRQRIETSISRKDVRPWLVSVESGCCEAIELGEQASFESIAAPAVQTRSEVKAVEATSGGDQTIRPDSDLLFVAGAGWTKKQSDSMVKTDKAAALILDFINRRKASLGSSKSMVDLSSEGHAVLPFLTHLHQIGQTGATPRHAKGLSTCCHGEEPHAVGWRFVKERRAINMDPNCGWAHGKADVLYVADAFEVMDKVNSLL
jgi:electron transfer flavoprotein alpha subunit